MSKTITDSGRMASSEEVLLELRNDQRGKNAIKYLENLPDSNLTILDAPRTSIPRAP